MASADLADTVTVGHAGSQASLPHRNDDPAAPAAGDTIGRYVVERELGAGGMGQVFLARDPELDRMVAVKLVKPTRHGTGHRSRQAEARLVREAQAMAQVSHPNVMPVYDVGVCAGQVFIAMEYVAGTTLRQWLETRPSLDRILDVFDQAGSGLAAAHAAGLIHRDFKPSNVIVGDDARVRVVDFGLARVSEDSSSWEPGASASASRSTELATDSALDRLTEVGEVMGTPAYMAPEQHASEPTDARSDQYAFGVALFEALYDQRPFSAKTIPGLAQVKATHTIARVHRDDVPARVHRAIVRALSPRPGDRFASMEQLLVRLRPRRSRPALWVIGGLAALGVSAFAFADRSPPALCASKQLHAQQVWSGPRRTALAQVFADGPTAYAPQTWKRVEASVDDHVARWHRASDAACLDEGATDPERARQFDLQWACLDRTLLELDAAMSVLERADADVIDRAINVVESLENPDRCTDPATLASESHAPPPDLAPRVTALRSGLAAARALEVAGRTQESLDALRPLLPEIESLGYTPLALEAKLLHANLWMSTGDFERAEPMLESIYFEAVESNLERPAFHAAARLAYLHGAELAHYDEAEQWLAHARAQLEAGHEDPVLSSRLLDYQAMVLRERGRYEEAANTILQAIELRQEAVGAEDHRMAQLYGELASIRHLQGDYEASLRSRARATDLHRQALGDDHPTTVMSMANAAVTQYVQGRATEAAETFEHIVESRTRVLGPDHLQTAQARGNLGAILFTLGRYDEALAVYEELAQTESRRYEDPHPNVAAIYNNLGGILSALDRTEEARDAYRRSIEIVEATQGSQHPDLAMSRANLAGALSKLGQFEDAEVEAREALRIRLAALPAGHQDIPRSRAVLAEALRGQKRLDLATRQLRLALDELPEPSATDPQLVSSIHLDLAGVLEKLDRPDEALPHAEQAMRIRDRNDSEPPQRRGDARFMVARLLGRDPAQRALALEQAQRAEDAYREAGDDATDERTQLERWRSQRRHRP